MVLHIRLFFVVYTIDFTIVQLLSIVYFTGQESITETTAYFKQTIYCIRKLSSCVLSVQVVNNRKFIVIVNNRKFVTYKCCLLLIARINLQALCECLQLIDANSLWVVLMCFN